ncbi:hypothetical protein RchiOBHm_Chr7g0232451 [Rosa chinensis]|uniref:Uncharacterized protein n=1 Tax=Rosa chinensis TaxID=74649 RepID=A0A2P6PFX2_ROSCH|nr:hypothetical protein RchiOBHm_Chr7g0232451 [Rosa chinensis]
MFVRNIFVNVFLANNDCVKQGSLIYITWASPASFTRNFQQAMLQPGRRRSKGCLMVFSGCMPIPVADVETTKSSCRRFHTQSRLVFHCCCEDQVQFPGNSRWLSFAMIN